MIYELPTRSPRKYRGKYPTKIHSFGYAKSPRQDFIKEYLSLGSRPVHVELNDGRRYIVPMKELREVALKLNTEFHNLPVDDTIQIVPLHPEYYEAMLKLLKELKP